METWQIIRLAIDETSDVAIAQGTGYDRSTIHKMGRHPADVENPDATGVQNFLDRVEGFIHQLAVRPKGRPVLRVLRTWFNAKCDEAVGGDTCALTAEELSQHTARICKEFGELVTECRPGDCDTRRLVKEGAEAVEAIERLMRAAIASR